VKIWQHAIKFLSKLWKKWQFSANEGAKAILQGPNGCSVDQELFVLRCVEPPHDYRLGALILPVQMSQIGDSGFGLSSADKASTPPHLSVWVDALTTPEQAYRFLPENRAKPKNLVLRISVRSIKQIVARESDSDVDYPGLLDVIWVHIDRSEPGAKGHAGITGLDDASIKKVLQSRGYQTLTKKQIRDIRKDLRLQLAELASQDARWLNDIE
jgi:hypothetical protein